MVKMRVPDSFQVLLILCGYFSLPTVTKGICTDINMEEELHWLCSPEPSVVYPSKVPLKA
jgi:hypothetical protein